MTPPRDSTTGGVPPGETPARRPDLEPDVELLHRAIVREPSDPEEGREPVPWWVWVAAVVAIFWGGWYLGRYGGTFDARTHVALRRGDAVVTAAAQTQDSTVAVNPVQAGQDIYAKRCSVCHQPNGQGMAGAFPPVVGSEWVTGAPEIPVRIVLHGLQGAVQVAGQTYNGAMPAWDNQLNDQDIAAVVTYIRQLAPNAAPAVDVALVSKLREADASRTQPWTAEELQATEGGSPP